MAGSYPNIPGERIAYELDSGILLQRYSNNTAWASVNDIQKTNFNKEKNMRNTGDSNTYLLDVASLFQVVFPVPYDIYGVYASVLDYFDFAGQVFISTDTTNGSDGTWNYLTTNLFPQNATRTYSTETDYRSKIANITGATGIKGIRFSSLYTGPSSQYIWLLNFHIYGSKSSTSNRIEFWNSDNTAELLPQDWDFGDTVEGSSEIKSFKVKNYLSTDIASAYLTIEVPTDPTISILNQYKLSTDQANWANTISIPTIPGQNIVSGGGVSETIYLKRADTELHTSGLFTGRVIVNIIS